MRAARQVTLADVCLVPQVANARRLKVPLEKFPKIVARRRRLHWRCQRSIGRGPENQPDAE